MFKNEKSGPLPRLSVKSTSSLFSSTTDDLYRRLDPSSLFAPIPMLKKSPLHFGNGQQGGDVCEICGRVLNSRSSYLYHKRTHTGEARFKCSHCPYKCIQKNQLNGHLRHHTNAMKQFVCHKCNFKSNVRHVVEKHLKVHQD